MPGNEGEKTGEKKRMGRREREEKRGNEGEKTRESRRKKMRRSPGEHGYNPIVTSIDRRDLSRDLSSDLSIELESLRRNDLMVAYTGLAG